jgi:ComF family protein
LILVTGIFSIGRELLFPSFCHLCKSAAEPGQPLCPECLSQMEYISAAKCSICGELFPGFAVSHVCGDCAREKPHFEKARAWVKFQEPAVQITHSFKYNRAFHFLDWMAAGMIGVFQKEYAGEKFDMVIPVSLHWLRLIQRGYNQALILARPLSRELKIPIRAGALIRGRNTPPQVGLSRNQRRENLKKVFRVNNPKLVKGKNILLVDDVITTGATVDEAAKVLRKAGAEKVSVLAFARA